MLFIHSETSSTGPAGYRFKKSPDTWATARSQPEPAFTLLFSLVDVINDINWVFSISDIWTPLIASSIKTHCAGWKLCSCGTCIIVFYSAESRVVFFIFNTLRLRFNQTENWSFTINTTFKPFYFKIKLLVNIELHLLNRVLPTQWRSSSRKPQITDAHCAADRRKLNRDKNMRPLNRTNIIINENRNRVREWEQHIWKDRHRDNSFHFHLLHHLSLSCESALLPLRQQAFISQLKGPVSEWEWWER